MKTNILRAKMALKGDYNERDLCDVIYASPMAVHRRMVGQIQFRASEIKAIAVKYNLTPEETTEIFDLGAGENDDCLQA